MMTAVSPTLFYEKGRNMVEQIKNYIDLGYGQKRIAKELGISRDRVITILKKNGLKTTGKFVNDVGDIESRVNEHYKGKWIYVGGYINCDSMMTIKCSNCGKHEEVSAQALRKDTIKRLCECDIAKKQEAKEQEYKLAKRKEYIYRSIANMKLTYKPKHSLNCLECGRTFQSEKVRKYCSDECMIRFNNSTKKHKKREQVLLNGSYQRIPLIKLIDRDNNVCHICGEQCDVNDVRINANGYKVFGNNYPTVDHLIPVKHGGTNTWDNVKLAHMICNSVKSDKSMLKLSNGMLQLNL